MIAIMAWDGGWPDVDPTRVRLDPRQLCGPVLDVTHLQHGQRVQVFQSDAVLTGRSSVRRAAKYATHRYLLRDEGGKQERGSRRPGY
jgi:hypothetical protein